MASEEIKKEASGTKRLSVFDFLRIALKNWKLFACFLILFVGYAVYKFKTTEPVYSRTATILVKEDNTSSMGALADAFGDFGGLNAASDVNNELEAIKSPAIMLQVIKNLKLSYNYTLRNGLRPVTLYGETRPFILSLPDCDSIEDRSFVFEGKLSPEGIYTISKVEMSKDGKNSDYSVDYKFNVRNGGTVQDPNAGAIVVEPNPAIAAANSAKPDKDAKTQNIEISWTPSDWLVTAHTSSLKASIPNRKAAVIELTYNDVSVARATDILNEVIHVYNLNWIEDKNLLTNATSKFVDERLRIIEQELNEVDSNISSFKSNNNIPDIQAMVESEMRKLSATDQRVLEVSSQLQIARNVLEYIQDANHVNDLLPSLGAVTTDQGLMKDILEYNTMMMDRNRLQASSSSSNPLVKDYDSRLSGMRSSINASVRTLISALETTLGDLRREQSQATSRISASPLQANSLLSNERQQKVKEALYLFLLERREENDLSQAFTAYNIRLLTPPMGPGAPIGPKLMRNLVIAIVLGLFIPFLIIFFRENFNTSVKTRAEIEDKVKAPFAGDIPQNGKPRRWYHKLFAKKEAEDATSEIVVKKGSSNAVNEAFRMVRSTLDRMNATLPNWEDRHGMVMMVTSAIPSSGKTFVSLNLAVSFALKKKRVLIVDADLRKGTISKSLGLDNIGLSGYLSGGHKLDNVIVHDVAGVEGLDAIPSGIVPPDPSELIDSEAFTDMVKTLRDRYDIILFDCPPTEAVTDADVISRNVDRTIYVIRRGNLKREFLPMIQRYYQEKHFRNLTIVFNGVDATGGSYGYGYGYGYGQKKESEK